jgi:outer membrane protein OmpA-like peptidoglycan-associated protein
MKQAVRMGILVPALVVVAAGCATKGWVREEMGRRDAEMGQKIARVDDRVGEESMRVDKRVETMEGRVAQQAQTSESMGVRVGTLETTVASTSEQVRGARERADAAMAKADAVDSRMTKLWNNRYNAKVVETINVQFGFDRSELDDGAQTALLGLVRELQANPNLLVELTGYTDMKGNREYNYTLSQRRVDAVRRFLAEKGVQLARIQAVGLGAMSDRGTPEAQKRRVAAKLMIEN